MPGSFRLADGAWEPTTILNLSLGGAFVAYRKVPMGTRVTLRFAVPTHEPQVEIGATVQWTDVAGIGLQFDGLRAREVWALNKHIESLPSHHSNVPAA